MPRCLQEWQWDGLLGVDSAGSHCATRLVARPKIPTYVAVAKGHSSMLVHRVLG